MKGSLLLSAAAFGAASIFSVSLQAAPAAPTPGQVQSTLPTQTPQPKKAPPPSVSQAPTNAAGVAPGGPAFKVNAFDIQGNTAISTDELKAQISGYVGQTLTLSQLYDVADVLTRYYRARGYGLAYVAPPAQKLSGGVVKLQVVEGRIGDINIQGNSRTRTSVLKQRAQSLQSGALYTDADAERAVLLMNDLPGESARAVVSPGAAYGTSDLTFNVDEHAFNGDFSVDDYGRASIGRWRLNADAAIDSLTGSGDQLSGGITHSEGNLLNFGKLAYLFPTGAASTLTVNFNRAFYHVGGVFAAANISGSTQNSGLTWQYAQIRTQPESLYWGIGVTHDTSRTLGLVTTNITLLQLTMLYTRQFQDLSYYNINGSFWTNGKSNADASNNDAEKAHFELDASWVKPFMDNWSFIGQAGAAYSADPLVDADKYSLGGPGNVRGFQSAEARGDRGVFGSAEVQRSFVPSVKFPLAWGVFVDSGKVWTIGVTPTASSPTAVQGGNTTLTSVGTELQLLPSSTGWNARLQLAWAIGATRPSDDVPAGQVATSDRGPHVWFTLGKTF